ncbi:TlpA disulfide reductase family protein [Microbulbifer sp.]|uniref:TlpA family protein disulfide reductase n=1 Tax=Microbulbifer sp. TaxID=1908541 RepID=UPI0025901D0E|nr:TlpA disulfide reductase family protein [Microbulbifer sp.]
MQIPIDVLIVACLCLAAALVSGCDSNSSSGKNVTYSDLSGDPIAVDGKVLVVNYWAEWCKPCREEIPELNQFQQSNQDRVQVIGISFDDLPVAEIRRQADKFGIAFPVLPREPEARWGQPRPQVLPTTLLIDAEGNWRESLVGPQSVESLEQALSRVVPSVEGESGAE